MVLRPTTTTARTAGLLVAGAVLLGACSDEVASPMPTIADDQLAASPEPVEDTTPVDEPATGTTPSPAPSPSEAVEPSPAVEASPPPTFDEVCAGREDEAFIEVLTPQDGDEVEDGFTVTGCGNTFEATYLYRVVLEDGTVATEGFGTMSCGSGCVGSFAQELELGVTGEVTLVVFESSAEDGSEMHVVERTFTVL